MPQRGWQFIGRVHEQRLLVQAGKKQRAEWLMDRSFYRSRHGHGDND